MRIYLLIFALIFMHAFVYLCMYTCLYVCIHVSLCPCIYVSMYLVSCICICMFVRVCVGWNGESCHYSVFAGCDQFTMCQSKRWPIRSRNRHKAKKHSALPIGLRKPWNALIWLNDEIDDLACQTLYNRKWNKMKWNEVKWVK